MSMLAGIGMTSNTFAFDSLIQSDGTMPTCRGNWTIPPSFYLTHFKTNKTYRVTVRVIINNTPSYTENYVVGAYQKVFIGCGGDTSNKTQYYKYEIVSEVLI